MAMKKAPAEHALPLNEILAGDCIEIMESLPERIRKKANRYAKVAERALEIIRALQPELDVSKD